MFMQVEEKSGNLYKPNYGTYRRLILKEFNARYVVTTENNHFDIYLEIKAIMMDCGLLDKTEPVKSNKLRISLKDCKRHFHDKSCYTSLPDHDKSCYTSLPD